MTLFLLIPTFYILYQSSFIPNRPQSNSFMFFTWKQEVLLVTDFQFGSSFMNEGHVILAILSYAQQKRGDWSHHLCKIKIISKDFILLWLFDVTIVARGKSLKVHPLWQFWSASPRDLHRFSLDVVRSLKPSSPSSHFFLLLCPFPSQVDPESTLTSNTQASATENDSYKHQLATGVLGYFLLSQPTLCWFIVFLLSSLW